MKNPFMKHDKRRHECKRCLVSESAIRQRDGSLLGPGLRLLCFLNEQQENNMKKLILQGHSTYDGAGVKLKRIFAHDHTELTDPFLLLDHFGSDNPDDYVKGFPWHPHRGIETVTYMLSGTVEHGDNIGNAGTIGPGDVQWMTAGGGVIHQEMPKAAKGMMHGLQLWVNLPAKDKMMEPPGVLSKMRCRLSRPRAEKCASSLALTKM